ncbi:hypothetical protein B4102_2137 [Heyndrickxia sporothermodurans]|uniref:HTH cro/C1-type domain-containing protein n=1 Tax=Heyndrickxia sporothermodurans TaxID=46224 RepID=A0A150LHC3_9BACI|nr:helix-turn-helix transcriptional regulator [Heyndrickxia sporothermodurans]KYD11409.1 hypothetical protein B4102_2137 [Heyndrickxia sporothermodurans]
MNYRELFKERLILLRTEKKLNQTELANELNVSKAIISKYEKGAASPSYEMLWKLANFFDVSVDYLIGKSNSFNGDPILNHEISEIIAIYDTLSDEEKKYAFKILKSFS